MAPTPGSPYSDPETSTRRPPDENACPAPRRDPALFRRSNSREATDRQGRPVRNSVGKNELQNFGKFRVSGRNARGWLDRIMAGRVPRPNPLALPPMLSPSGRLMSDLTISCLSETEFRRAGSYGAQEIHLRWFETHLEDDVDVENVSVRVTGFQIAGLRTHDPLALATRDPTDPRLLDVRPMAVRQVTCLVHRMSYGDDPGFRLYCPPMNQCSLWKTLWEADRPISAGADSERAVLRDRVLEAFTAAVDDAHVQGHEPIWIDGRVQGLCTSGGYPPRAGVSVASGFVPRDRARDGLGMRNEFLDERRPARPATRPPFHAEGERTLG
nr:glycine cleavage T C-terminal barrel domain-containing protein [Histidinibacterium lentulum]